MKTFLVGLIAIICFIASPVHGQGRMEISLSALAPQAEDGRSLDATTYGWGASATYVHEQTHDNFHIIGTLQYHEHDATDTMRNRDIVLGGGLRATAWGFYLQGAILGIEKRDQANVNTSRDDNIGGLIGAGFNLDRIGIGANLYLSDFGNHYGTGLTFRF